MSSRNIYDTRLSFLHKEAKRLQIPVRFLVYVKDNSIRSVDEFDLSEHNAVFHSLFDIVNSMELDPIDIFNHPLLANFTPLERIYIWLFSNPDMLKNENINYALEQIDTYLKSVRSPLFKTTANLRNQFNTQWMNYLTEEYNRDLRLTKQFLDAQEVFSNITPLAISPIDKESVTLSYKFFSDVNPLPDYFDNAKTSIYVPFIQYNDTTTKYKIYRGAVQEERTNYNNLIIPTNITTDKDTIYVNLWVGYGEGDYIDTLKEINNARKEDFQVATISYNSDKQLVTVTIEIPADDKERSPEDVTRQDVMMQRLLDHVSDLEPPKDLNEDKITGTFYIYGTSYDENVLHYLLLNNPLFSSYLYIKESTKPLALKKRVVLNYRATITEDTVPNPKSQVSALITNEIFNIGNRINVNERGETKEYTLEQVYPAIQFKLLKAESTLVAEQFANIVSRLFTNYNDLSTNVFRFLERYVPVQTNVEHTESILKPSGELPSTIVEGEVVIGKRQVVKLLRSFAGDLFVKNYARNCQSEKKPLLIKPEEVDEWKSKTFINKRGEEEHYQVVEFPFESQKRDSPYEYPQLFLVCNSTTFPYIGVRENPMEENKHMYPYIPCCYKVDHINNPKKMIYSLIHDQETTTKKQSKANYILSTDKVLDPERLSKISTLMLEFLDSEGDDTYLRYGVHRNVNSFIHCIFVAFQYRDYILAKDKEQFVSNFRKNLLNYVYPEVLKQEMYDMSYDMIKEYIQGDYFFDPLLFYRAFEEMFQCNIYITHLNEIDRTTKKEQSLIYVPRHQYFHARSPRKLDRTVIVIRHMGAESDKLEYPQVELLVRRMEDRREVQFVFGEDMNKKFYDLSCFAERTLTWQLVNNVLVTYQNMYSAYNFVTSFGQIPILGQVIDSAGKCRMLMLAPQIDHQGQFTDLRIFVGIPPSSPLNIPRFDIRAIRDYLPTLDIVLQMFGQVSSYTFKADSKTINGVWFPLGDITYGLYCPVQDTIRNVPIQEDLVSKSLTIPLPKGDEYSDIDRYRDLRKSATYIIQLLQYLYIVAGRPENINEFVDSILIGASPDMQNIDTARIYNPKLFKRILPFGNTPQEILSQLTEEIPTLFHQNRLLIMDSRMYVGILYELKEYAKAVKNIPLDPNRMRSLVGYYSNRADYKTSPSEFLLLSHSDYSLWKDIYIPSTQQTNLKNIIQTSIDPTIFTYRQPFIYQELGNNLYGPDVHAQYDKYYIIQNVVAGEFLRAINVANTWRTEKRNHGYTTPRYEGQTLPAYKIYSISSNGVLVLSQDNSYNSPDFLHILEYNKQYYGAILPIL